MPTVLSVNIGAATTMPGIGVTGIDKQPVSRSVQVRAPGPKGVGGSGLVGDAVCDRRHHGGDHQAVYAYAREDLDTWAAELDRPLPAGAFGENLTTSGVDITNAVIGERWQLGDQVVLEVSCPRIPCRVFARKLGERHWVRTFTARAVPGAYLRVIEPGVIKAGDPVQMVSRPDHDITVGLSFRALTTERDLLPRLLVADTLAPEALLLANARTVIKLDEPD
ncbi:MAG: MOSC domain-containing protein [Kibdelosporangium sp.]